MKASVILASALSVACVHAIPQTNAAESFATFVQNQDEAFSTLFPQYQTNPIYSDVYSDLTAVWASLTAAVPSLTQIVATNAAASRALDSYIEQVGPLISAITQAEQSVPTGAAASLEADRLESVLASLTGGAFPGPTGDSDNDNDNDNLPSVNPEPTDTSTNAGPTPSAQLGAMGAAAVGFLGLAAFL